MGMPATARQAQSCFLSPPAVAVDLHWPLSSQRSDLGCDRAKRVAAILSSILDQALSPVTALRSFESEPQQTCTGPASHDSVVTGFDEG